MFYSYTYNCPNCVKLFVTDKGANEVKICKHCKHTFVSTVLFEE